MSRLAFERFVALSLFLLIPASLSAQSGNVPLSQLLPNLVLNGIQLAVDPRNINHNAHFTPGQDKFGTNELNQGLRSSAEETVNNFNSLFMSQLATFPLGSSSGGFTYNFDPSLNTWSRSSSSFGPSFTERGLTIGRRKLSIGFNYQHTSYDSLEGKDLQNNSIQFILRHDDCCGATPPGGNGDQLKLPFEGDVIEAQLSVKATNDTGALFANYGVTDRWDLGIAVPIVRVHLDARVHATINRLATKNFPLTHTFRQGQDVSEIDLPPKSGTASGIGDVVLRSKYNFFRAGSGHVAAAIDLRLPTGDRDNLLGTGATQAKLFLIGSSGTPRFAQHINIGYTASNSKTKSTLIPGSVVQAELGRISDEFNYAGGVEFVPTAKVTIVADLLGRTLRKVDRLEDVATQPFQYKLQLDAAEVNGSTETFTSPSFTEFGVRPGATPRNLNLLIGAFGVKFNPTGNLLISASVLVPLTDSGLRDRFTPVIGLDYAF